MSLKLFKRKPNTFQVAVGEEGAVVVYTQSGYAKAKIFVKSTDPADTEKLRDLLAQDKDAAVYIYIDTMDQSYVQRSLPAVSSMGIGKIAQKHLEKEIPKGHLKTCVQIGRAPTGRHDWIYTFVSSGMEPPISNWIEFFIPYHNIIAGIYFLPIEIYSVVIKLRKIALSENQFKEKTRKVSFLQTITGGGQSSTASGRWEVYLSQNKTGGFRQAAFQDGKIVFSRLLSNINDPSPDIVAGNVEQEIANSIEYMTRLSLGGEQEVDVYLVLSADILRYLRREKIKATNLVTFTPSELASKLKVPEAATEKDKFADPTILTILSKVQKKIITLHTAATEKVYNYTRGINYFAYTLVALIPIMLVGSFYFVNDIYDLKESINQIKTQVLNFQAQLNEQSKKMTETEAKIIDPLSSDHIVEIVEIDKFFTSVQVDPVDIIQKLSAKMPEYARAKVIRWSMDDPILMNFSFQDPNNKNSSLDKKREYKTTSDFEVLIKRSTSSYEELEDKYTNFTKNIIKSFSDFDIAISDLPQNISFQDVNSPISMKFELKFPATKNGVVTKTPAAPQIQISQPPLRYNPKLQQQQTQPQPQRGNGRQPNTQPQPNQQGNQPNNQQINQQVNQLVNQLVNQQQNGQQGGNNNSNNGGK